MSKQMASFRLSEDATLDLESIARILGVTRTAALELCIDWAFKSGMVYGMENVKRRDGKISVRRKLDMAVSDYEIANTVKSKIWTAS